MKKTTKSTAYKRVLFSFIFINILFVYALSDSHAQGGADCASAQANPITIPFNAADQNFWQDINDYDGKNVTCGAVPARYLEAEDYLYYFVAPTTGAIFINIFKINQTFYKSVSVYKGCPDEAPCVGGTFKSFASSDCRPDGMILTVNVLKGEGYFILVDGDDFGHNYEFRTKFDISVKYLNLNTTCDNVDFENGDFSGWHGTTGCVLSGTTGHHANYVAWNEGIAAPDFTIVKSGNDPYGGFPKVFQGKNSVMIGDSSGTEAHGAQLIKTLQVTNDNTAFTYNYAIVTNATTHGDSIQSFFKVAIYDENGDTIKCAQQLIITDSKNPGFINSSTSGVYYKPWSSMAVDLSPYVGQTITIIATAADYTGGSQFTYAYFDCSCNDFELEVSGDYCPATITAPAGFLSYKWSPGGETTPSITVNQSGKYCCEMKQGDCTTTICKDVTISLAVNINSVNTLCGQCIGSVTVTPTSGTAPYSYLWSPNMGTTQSITNLCAGDYDITISDKEGCFTDTTIKVIHSDGPILSFLTSNVSCYGASDGSINLSITGGTPGYKILWSNTTTDEDLGGLPAGEYCVTVTDNNNCTAISCVTVKQPQQMLATITGTNVSCFGGDNGKADLTVTAGSSPYQYVWSNSETSKDLSDLIAGTYCVTVTDNDDCSATACVTITEPADLTPQINSTTNVSCFGGSDGAALAEPTGGTKPYKYKWNNNVDTALNTSLPAGVFTVTVTDANGCTDVGTVTITEPTELVLTPSATDATCTQSDGAVSVSVAGGVNPYSYAWDDPLSSTTVLVSGLPLGTYHVTVTDKNSCTKSTAVKIKNIGAPTLTIQGTDVPCYGDCNGAAESIVTGGATPYQYIWSNGQTTPSLSNLCAGDYSLTITDAAACKSNDVITISEPDELITEIVTKHITCFEDADGEADLTITGGTLPFTYSWTNGATSQDLNGLTAGEYCVTVTDKNNCTATSCVTITEPQQLLISEAVTNVSCYGICDGKVNLTVTGGTLPYIYKWSNGSTVEDLTNLCDGIYHVTVTDGHGCKDTVSITITEPLYLDVSETHTDALCFNDCNGTATVTPIDGVSPYTIKWSDGSNTDLSRTDLCADFYMITVTDANGCKVVTDITINEPTALQLSVTNTPISGTGLCDGTATATPTGGTTPYSYKWSTNPVQTTQTVTNLCAGNYYVTVTDKNGCSKIDTVSVTLDIPIVESEPESYTLYPNPTYGQVNIELINMTVEKAEVYDVSGRMLLSQDNTGKMILLNIAHLSPGTYFVRLVSGKQVYHQKIILQNKL